MTDLLNSNSTDPFSNVVTERSLLDERPLGEEVKELIARYHDTFETVEDFRAFTEGKLGMWKNTLEFKYFDALYTNYRSTNETITNLRRQAQKLLEEAEKLQDRNFGIRKHIEQHVKTITRKDLRQRILNPSLVRFRTTLPPELEYPPASTRIPRPSPSGSSNTIQPPISYARTTRGLRCFQCESPHHIKWYCPLYTCKICKIRTPGHAQKNCPRRETGIFDDGLRGHFDISGDYDGNLTGEC